MIAHAEDGDPGHAPVPAFAAIDHPAFPRWMLDGLDRMFALERRITRIRFDLWAHTYPERYLDREFRGSAVIHASGGLTEEDLDEVPPVRMFERRAGDLWEHLPISVDDSDASVSGELEINAERGLVLFEFRTNRDLEHTLVIEARHDGEGWKLGDRIVLSCHDGPSSDLLADDPAAVLATYDEHDLMLGTMPTATAVDVMPDGEVVVHLEPGELTRCMQKR